MLIEIYYFIHSIKKHVLSTPPQARHHGSCKHPYDFVFSLKLLHNQTRTVNLLLARDKYGWLLRLVSFPLSLAEQKTGSAQWKISGYQALGSRGLLFLIRPLPWPESFHCYAITQRCPDHWPYKCIEHSLPERWLCMVHTDIHAGPKLWEDSSNDCVHAATCLLINCSPNKTRIIAVLCSISIPCKRHLA